MHSFFILSRMYFLLLLRQRGPLLTSVGFFLAILTLFPLAVGLQPETLTIIGPGVLWVAAILALLLPIYMYYDEDYTDGSLEILVLKLQHLEAMVLARVALQWLSFTVPILLCVPLAQALYGMEALPLIRAAQALALGLLLFTSLGSLAAALTLGIKQRSGLVYLLALPLFIPVVLFGVGSMDASVRAADAISFLYGMVLVGVPLSIWLTGHALKASIAYERG